MNMRTAYGMRIPADRKGKVVEHQTQETSYLQCSPPRQPADGFVYSSDQCPICLLPCSYDGDRTRVCLIACGHIFCEKCIIRWMELKKANAKCPLCNTKLCMLKLKSKSEPSKSKAEPWVKVYASPAAADDQVYAQTRVKELEAENAALRTEKATLMDIGKLSEITYNVQQDVIKELRVKRMKRQSIECFNT